MILSAIVPTFNEEKYIFSVISDFLANAPTPSEIFIVDAESTDKTAQIVKEFSQNYSNVHFVVNRKRTVSFAFNTAFSLTSGKYICLLGAHAKYDKDYFSIGCKYLEDNEADVVGGFLVQEGQTDFGIAVAFAMANKIGVGNTKFRTERKKTYVDSVSFALYKREIFEKVGLLDENIIRNQDDELHYRLNRYGYRLLMVPEISATYQVRNTMRDLWRQYFDYGYYKPYVIIKNPNGMKISHLVPMLFVFYLLILPLLLSIYTSRSLFILAPLFMYFCLIVGVSLTRPIQPIFFFNRILAFVVLHTSYGLGFIGGLFFKSIK